MPTPLVSGEALGLGRLLLKAESLQRTGSFKPRGAFNAVLQLTPAQRAKGVITLSAGNHGQALAWAASTLRIPCLVAVPDTAPVTKVDAMQRFGADVIQAPALRLHETMEGEQRRRGLHLVHPFADPAVIAGQGTVGLEIIAAAPDVDTVVVPVGGGGLISGIALAVRAQRPKVRIVGVEPVGAAVVSQSLAAGQPMTLERIETVADGLAPPYTREINLSLIQRYVDSVVQVTDDLLLEALRLILFTTKFLVEPAGAAAIAAILSGAVKIDSAGATVAILTGGNVDPHRLQSWLAR